MWMCSDSFTSPPHAMAVLALSHSSSLSLVQVLYLCLTPSLSFILVLTRSLSHSLVASRTHTRCLTHTHSLPLSRTHCLPHSFSISLPHSLSLLVVLSPVRPHTSHSFSLTLVVSLCHSSLNILLVELVGVLARVLATLADTS